MLQATFAGEGVAAADGKLRPGKAFDEEAGSMPVGCGCEGAPQKPLPPHRPSALRWIAPIILFLGLCVHSVFEGLAVGLQVSLLTC